MKNSHSFIPEDAFLKVKNIHIKLFFSQEIVFNNRTLLWHITQHKCRENFSYGTEKHKKHIHIYMKHKKSVAKMCYYVCCLSSMCTMLGEIGINFQRLEELNHIFLQVQGCISQGLTICMNTFPSLHYFLRNHLLCAYCCASMKGNLWFYIPYAKRQTSLRHTYYFLKGPYGIRVNVVWNIKIALN